MEDVQGWTKNIFKIFKNIQSMDQVKSMEDSL